MRRSSILSSEAAGRLRRTMPDMRLRRSVVRTELVVVLVLATAACTADDEDPEPKATEPPAAVAWEFVTRPDLTPPLNEVTTTDAAEVPDEGAAADGLVLLGVKDQADNGAPMNGPVIVLGDG